MQRVTNFTNPNLTGAWNINSLNSQQTSHMVEINDKQVVFCQRFATINYTIGANNRIFFNNLTAGLCDNKDVLNVFSPTLYFVIKNKTIDLYN